jgi:D-aspartate ligase
MTPADGPLPPILLCDATWLGSLAAVRDLGRRGVPVIVAYDTLVAPARWSRYVSRAVPCPPKADHARFVQWLLEFGSANPGTVLYPTSDDVAWLVSAHREELAHHFRLFSPPLEALGRVLDKGRLALDGAAAGLPIPRTWSPADEAELDRVAAAATFPLFVKPRTQIAGRGGLGKGRRVEDRQALLAAWRVGAAVAVNGSPAPPDGQSMPIVQQCTPRTERIYTVDGFVDETGELYAALACTKLLQRPRAWGPGVIFEHSPLAPELAEGLRRLCVATGFHGVFDAEFVEANGERLFIDFNPRFYNHMAFETDRGLPLSWMAYLAARGERQALREAVAEASSATSPERAYVQLLPTRAMLGLQGLAGNMTREERRRWLAWISAHRGKITDPAYAADDRGPAVAVMAMELLQLVKHPRSYLRQLSERPVT